MRATTPGRASVTVNVEAPGARRSSPSRCARAVETAPRLVEAWEKRAKLQHYGRHVSRCRIYLAQRGSGRPARRQRREVLARRPAAGATALSKPYRDADGGASYQWCIAAVPGAAWAKKVFPHEHSRPAAVEKLWEAILLHLPAWTTDPIADCGTRTIADLQGALRPSQQPRHPASLELPCIANGTNLTVGMIPDGRSFAADAASTRCGGSYL